MLFADDRLSSNYTDSNNNVTNVRSYHYQMSMYRCVNLKLCHDQDKMMYVDLRV